MLEGGETFTHAVYQMRRTNLEAFKGPKDGFVIDPCFQEVDVATGRAVFRWYVVYMLVLRFCTQMSGQVRPRPPQTLGNDNVPPRPWPDELL